MTAEAQRRAVLAACCAMLSIRWLGFVVFVGGESGAGDLLHSVLRVTGVGLVVGELVLLSAIYGYLGIIAWYFDNSRLQRRLLVTVPWIMAALFCASAVMRCGHLAETAFAGASIDRDGFANAGITVGLAALASRFVVLSGPERP